MRPTERLGAFRLYVRKVLCMCFVEITSPLKLNELKGAVCAHEGTRTPTS